jgi:hypothetical protein
MWHMYSMSVDIKTVNVDMMLLHVLYELPYDTHTVTCLIISTSYYTTC